MSTTSATCLAVTALTGADPDPFQVAAPPGHGLRGDEELSPFGVDGAVCGGLSGTGELRREGRLRTLAWFAAAADELAGLRGEFAAYAGRFGPGAVAVASRRLLTVWEQGTGGAMPAFRSMGALVRPLAWIAEPGSGLALDLPPRLLDEEFGTGAIVSFEDVDFPATLTHEPTRRFLRDIGLPEEAAWFTLDTDVPPRTLAEYGTDDHDADLALPPDSDRLIRLGHITPDTSLVIDGTTGTVLYWTERDALPRPLTTDLSTLAFTLWLLRREELRDVN
ncbi:SUKH-4 family immunity protein [Streptomyces sp. NPDC051963]|uniref:SUKH-4 family immunity protein n=1 Tax=Streptomyces sp. NPDC051963 TaxID=3365678 RepID=UPI0037D562BD